MTFDFVKWDDDRIFYENQRIENFGSDNLKWMFTDSASNSVYMPFGWVLITASNQVFGMSSQAQHAISVVFHAVNALLVFAILRSLAFFLFRDRGCLTIFAAFLGACFWAVHPLRVEAFTWISARVHTQSCFFLFISCLLYFQSRHESYFSRSTVANPWYWGAVTFYGISILTFPSGLAVPAAWLILDLYVLRDRSKNITAGEVVLRASEKIPFAFVAVVSILVSLSGQVQSPMGAIPSLEKVGLGARFMQACYVWMIYAWETIYPVALSPFYTRMVNPDRFSFVYRASVIALLFVTGSLFFFRKHMPNTWLAWLLHLILLIPFLGLALGAPYASDRYTYTEAIVWAAMIMGLVIEVGSRGKSSALCNSFLVGGVGVWLAVLVVLSVRQEFIWANSENLLKHMMAQPGGNVRRADFSSRLGTYYLSHGRFDESLSAFDDCLVASHNHPLALMLKGNALFVVADHSVSGPDHETIRHQMYLDAARYLDGASQAGPTTDLLTRAGNAYLRAREWRTAASRFDAALRISPTSASGAFLLAEAMYCAGDADQATKLLDAVIRADPSIAGSREATLRAWDAEKSPKKD